MQNLILTKSKFVKMAHRLAREQRKAGVDLPFQTIVNMLSLAVFDKTYEAAIATSFEPEENGDKQSEANVPAADPKVFKLLEYGNEMILLKDGEYVSGNYPGTDLYVSNAIFIENAKTLAKYSEGVLVQECLPKILAEDCNTDDVILLAGKLGMLKEHDSIFNLIEKSSLIKINGIVTEYTLNGDYFGELETAFENGEPPFEVCIWMPESVDKLNLHEYYFTLQDLADATTSDGGKTWQVENCIVEFF